MPKKFATDNPKALAARERKKNAKDAEEAKKQQAAEDASWRDDDKQILKKQQKKEEMEKKKQQLLEKRAEAKALLEKEMSSIKLTKAPPQQKITRAQIRMTPSDTQKDTKTKTHLDCPLIENLNRINIDGDDARTVAQAIAILNSGNEDMDLHPEKRQKAAYTAFEAKRLKELKDDNPSLRLSQLKQMIFKEWQKSPENPMNAVMN